jgi:hypothetical protein
MVAPCVVGITNCLVASLATAANCSSHCTSVGYVVPSLPCPVHRQCWWVNSLIVLSCLSSVSPFESLISRPSHVSVLCQPAAPVPRTVAFLPMKRACTLAHVRCSEHNIQRTTTDTSLSHSAHSAAQHTPAVLYAPSDVCSATTELSMCRYKLSEFDEARGNVGMTSCYCCGAE